MCGPPFEHASAVTRHPAQRLAMPLIKADLAQHIADAMGLTKREATEMVEAVFGEIAAARASNYGPGHTRRRGVRVSYGSAAR